MMPHTVQLAPNVLVDPDVRYPMLVRIRAS